MFLTIPRYRYHKNDMCFMAGTSIDVVPPYYFMTDRQQNIYIIDMDHDWAMEEVGRPIQR